jgi:hypothetical protein
MMTDSMQGRPLNAEETFQAAIELIRSDRLRGFRVDIETDTMVAEDEEAEKASRVEFIQAATGFLNQAIPAAQQFPQAAPLLGEILMFGLRSFKSGRTLEVAFEQFVEQSKNAPPAPQDGEEKGNPEAEAAKAQADMIRAQADQTRAQIESQKLSLEEMKLQMQHSDQQHRRQLDLMRIQNEEAERQRKHEIEVRRVRREEVETEAGIAHGAEELAIKRDKVEVDEARVAVQAQGQRDQSALQARQQDQQREIEGARLSEQAAARHEQAQQQSRDGNDD